MNLNRCFLISQNISAEGTKIFLYGLGGLLSLPPINSPDIITHIKGLSYLSDYWVIRVSLGEAFLKDDRI